MNILLTLLLIIFVFTEIPLIMLAVYLFRNPEKREQVRILRRILLSVTLAKIMFIFEDIILVFVSLFHIANAQNFLVGTFTGSAVILFCVNWWAFFKIRQLI